MARTKPNKSALRYRNYILYGLLLALLALALLPRLEQLKDGLLEAKQANIGWLIIACVYFWLTYIAATVIFLVLAKSKPLRFDNTLLVQVASSFANRLLPGGVGGFGLSVHYLKKRGYNTAEASAVVAMSGLVAFTSYLILLSLALAISGIAVASIVTKPDFPAWAMPVVIYIVTSIAVTLLVWKKIRSWLLKLLASVWRHLLRYRSAPLRVLIAFLVAAALTIFYVFALFACTKAVGLDLTLTQAFITYTVGVVMGAAVFTPGGLGGMEAGVFAALISFDNSSPGLAFSVVILFRLITFWLPIIPGYISFSWLRHRRTI